MNKMLLLILGAVLSIPLMIACFFAAMGAVTAVTFVGSLLPQKQERTEPFYKPSCKTCNFAPPEDR